MNRIVVLCSFLLSSALRLPSVSQCLDFNSDKFPLKVDDLISSSNGDKKAYFDTIKGMGIDDHLSVVGQKLSFSCLKQTEASRSHIIFIGDSTMRQLHMKFLELNNKEVSQEERDQRMNFHTVAQKIPDEYENILFQKLSGPINAVMTDAGDTASYVGWMGETGIVNSLKSLTAGIQPADTVVFWIGASVHLFQRKRQGLLASWRLRREDTLRQLLADMKEKFPNATVVYDTIPYLDTALMQAKPPKPDAQEFVAADAMHVAQHYGEVDEKVCTELGIAHTDRTKLGRYYRGLTADGMHLDNNYGAEKSYAGFYELVMQSGLARACTKKPANFCKNLDQYDPRSGPNP